jgi:hypothetical protein
MKEIARKVKLHQSGKRSDFGWYATNESVVGQLENEQIGELKEGGRN